MTTLDFLATILTILAGLASFLVAFRKTRDWPTWQTMSVAIVVATMCILIIFTMVHVVFDQAGSETLSVPPIAEQTPAQPSEEETAPPATPAPVEEDTEPQMVMETQDRTFKFGTRNRHCRGPQNVRWGVSATPGWKIDEHSITVRPTVQSSRSSLDGVTDPSPEGFYIKGRVVNSGKCIKAFGQTIAKDGRGSLHVAGTYKETRMVPGPS